MAISTTPRMGMTRFGAGTDPTAQLVSALRNHADRVEAIGVKFGSGQISTRPAPAAANAGMIWQSALGTLSWCDGTAWWSIGCGYALDLRDFMDGSWLTAPIAPEIWDQIGVPTGAALMHGSGSDASVQFQAALNTARARGMALLLPAGQIGGIGGPSGGYLRTMLEVSGATIIGPGSAKTLFRFADNVPFAALMQTAPGYQYADRLLHLQGFRIRAANNQNVTNGVVCGHGGRTGRFIDVDCTLPTSSIAGFYINPAALAGSGSQDMNFAGELNSGPWLFDHVVAYPALRLVGASSQDGLLNPVARIQNCSLVRLHLIAGGTWEQCDISNTRIQFLEVSQPTRLNICDGSDIRIATIGGNLAQLWATNSTIRSVNWGATNGIVDMQGCTFPSQPSNAANFQFGNLAGKNVSFATRSCIGWRTAADLATVATGSLTSEKHAGYCNTDGSTVLAVENV